jgi:hypothetical protein
VLALRATPQGAIDKAAAWWDTTHFLKSELRDQDREIETLRREIELYRACNLVLLFSTALMLALLVLHIVGS